MKLGFEGRALVHKQVTGVERYSIEILKQLKKMDDVSLEIFQPKTKNRYLQHIWEYTILPKLARKHNVDILFCPTGAAPFNLNKNIKLAVTIHDIAFLNFPHLYSKRFMYYYKIVLPKIIKRADIIFAVSNSEKSQIQSYYDVDSSKIVTVYEAAGDIFVDKKIEREDIILAVASLNKNKNLISLIKAFKLIMQQISHKLVLIGGQRSVISSDSEIFDLIKSIPQDRIVMTGYVDDDTLVNYYNRAKLFVFPSFYEGFGIPPLEAMACGCPILTSNISSLPEVCKDAALYANPYNVKEIANQMLHILTDKKLSMDLISKGYIRTKELTWEKTAKNIITYLKELK